MAWVRARFCKSQKGCTRLAAASDKVYQLLAHGRWFSTGIPDSSTTKTGRHDIAEILLKVVLKNKNQINLYARPIYSYMTVVYTPMCLFYVLLYASPFYSYMSFYILVCAVPIYYCHTAIQNLSDPIGYLLDFTNPYYTALAGNMKARAKKDNSF